MKWGGCVARSEKKKWYKKSRKHTYEDHKEIVSVGVLYRVKCNGILHWVCVWMFSNVISFGSHKIIITIIIYCLNTSEAKLTKAIVCLNSLLVSHVFWNLLYFFYSFLKKKTISISKHCRWQRYRKVNTCRWSGFGFWFNLFMPWNATKSIQFEDKIGIVACFGYSIHR